MFTTFPHELAYCVDEAWVSRQLLARRAGLHEASACGCGCGCDSRLAIPQCSRRLSTPPSTLPLQVTGEIPKELEGTYFRNNPALHVHNPRFQRHTLDGDGMIFSMAFKDGKAFWRNRFVRTAGFLAEQVGWRAKRLQGVKGETSRDCDLTFISRAPLGNRPLAGLCTATASRVAAATVTRPCSTRLT
jgi:hypothetical protein